MMKKNKRLICTLVLAWLLIFGMSIPSFAVGVEVISAESRGISSAVSTAGEAEIGYYGREALEGLEGSEALLYAYDSIYNGVEQCLDSIEVFDGEHALSADDMAVVFDTYERDHPEHFWLGGKYGYEYNDMTVTKIKPTYLMSGQELNTSRKKFETIIAEILNAVPEGASEYETELLIHDKLAERVEYIKTGNAYNAYGAIVEGKAVCEGYSEALAYLLRLKGIKTFIVTGESANPTTGDPEGHEWIVARIDGEWYHVDITWNDQGESIYHAYFNKTEAEILEDHKIDALRYALPSCTSDAADYFSVSEKALEVFDTEGFDECLTRVDTSSGEIIFDVYVTGNTDEFIAQMCDSISDIAERHGVSGSFSYGYRRLGRELIVTIYSSEISGENEGETGSEGGSESATEGTNGGHGGSESSMPTENVTEAPTEGASEPSDMPDEGSTEGSTEVASDMSDEGSTEAESEMPDEGLTEGLTEWETESTTGGTTEGTGSGDDAENNGGSVTGKDDDMATEGVTEKVNEKDDEKAAVSILSRLGCGSVVSFGMIGLSVAVASVVVIWKKKE